MCHARFRLVACILALYDQFVLALRPFLLTPVTRYPKVRSSVSTFCHPMPVTTSTTNVFPAVCCGDLSRRCGFKHRMLMQCDHKVLRVDSTQQVELGPLLARGSYGEVYIATLNGSDGSSLEVVAKRALARNPAHGALSKQFLESEAAINADVKGSPGVCGYLGEATSSEGELYLLFDRIRPLDGSDGPADSCEYLRMPECKPVPVTPREALRQLLATLAHLHRSNYIHHDVKLENILLEASLDSTPSLKLIDFGFAVSVDSCDLFGRFLRRCDLDNHGAPHTKAYRPPERFADTDYPFAYDIFCSGMCFLLLAWADAMDSGPEFKRFREELDKAGGDLECWLRNQLSSAVLSEALMSALSRFPGNDAQGFYAIRAMLHPDPAKRPSADALLSHPFLAGSHALDSAAAVNTSAMFSWLDNKNVAL